MIVEFHRAKRDQTKIERGLDFADFPELLDGPHLEKEDTRKDYGERRFSVMGYLRGRLVVAVYTPRKGHFHVLSMRKANTREEKKFKKAIDGHRR